uniref:Glycosyltransferase family 92 protein n=1 Tax=Gongylonema pulchrum TaxID=637853 RepID=A0A183DFG6_9BILA
LPYDVEMFQNGNINISGFQIINREIKEYLNLKRHLLNLTSKKNADDLDIEAKAVFVHDAVVVARAVFATALRRNDSLFRHNFRHGELYNRGFPGIYCHPITDVNNPNRPFTTFEHGQTLARTLRGVRIHWLFMAPELFSSKRITDCYNFTLSAIHSDITAGKFGFF